MSKDKGQGPGMVGTRTLHQLIQTTQRSRTKLVLVGDPRQLPEIDAGGLFATLANRLPAVTLTGNQRQTARWEQQALRQLRTGDVLHALTAYQQHHRLRVGDTIAELTDQLLTDYQTSVTQHGRDQVLVIASSRSDARRLTATIRQHLISTGQLGDQELHIPIGRDGRQRGYRTGEQILITANDYSRALLNGTRGTITRLHPDQSGLTVRLDDGRQVELNAAYLHTGHLAHGYALTAHKAQGVTVDVALLWATNALTRETGYVALSRGRTANYLYATSSTLHHNPGDSDLDQPRQPGQPNPTARRALTTAALTQRLDTSSRQRTARSWWRPRHAPHDSPPQQPDGASPARPTSRTHLDTPTATTGLAR